MRNRLLLIIVFFLILCNVKLLAQSNFSIRMTGICANPGTISNLDLYKNKITDNGKFSFEPGLQLSFELFGNVSTSLKLVQTVQNDAAAKISGATQLMFRFRLFKIWKHYVVIGFGPVAHYRQNWNSFENYEEESLWETNGNMQKNISWLSGEIEYNYYLGKKGDLCISINHVHPESVALFVGYKYWFSRKSGKCKTCPSFN